MKGFISKDLHSLVIFMLLLAFMLGSVFVAYFFYAIAGEGITGVSFLDLSTLLQNPSAYPEQANTLMFFQGLTSFFMFIVAPLALIKAMGYNWDHYLNRKEKSILGLVLLSGLLVVLIMPLNSVIINWNAEVNFPAALEGFEKWARQQESKAEQISKLIADFGTIPQLLVGLLVMAVIPGIGEELVFRGIIQRQLHSWWGNPHVAIWVAAILFSAIHVQFFGFVPRVLLGALFGYLYFWSGRMIVPVVAHFVNNGFIVLLLYLQQTKAIDFDVESTEPMAWTTVLLSAVLSAAVLYFLYKQFAAQPVRTASISGPEEKTAP